MLYSRWQDTLGKNRDRTAVIDGSERWTFAGLADRLASLPQARQPVLARGSVAEIIVSVLQGWRDGQAVLPLEKDAPEPELPAVFPDATAHLKLTPGIAGKPRA